MRSTHKTKYVGIAIVSYKISFLWKLFADILNTLNIDSILLYRDNKGAIIIAINPDIKSLTSRSRYIDIRYYITQKALINNTLCLEYIRSFNMVADILIKSLPLILYNKYCDIIGLKK